jgi:hypothetical protein
MFFKLQKDFPYLEEYRQKFEIDEQTIFAYDGQIYSNEPLPPDLLIHEEVHLKQQSILGADKWVKKYLEDEQFRLTQEIEAFWAQINHFKDRNQKAKSRILCARVLSGNMYGNLISFEEAMKILWKSQKT